MTPFRVHLDVDHPSALLKIRNEKEQRIVVQIEAFAWQQDAGGVDQYEPSSDLVVFPKIVEIQGKEEKSIRIGLPGVGRVERERALRVYLQELPVPEPGMKGLQVGLRLGVPVFFTAQNALPVPAIEPPDLDHDTLVARVRNPGNVNFFVGKLTATGMDSAGAPTFQREQAGWYVLAGSERTFRLPLEPGEREKSKTIRVSATIVDTRPSGKTSSVEAHLEAPGGSGDPASNRGRGR